MTPTKPAFPAPDHDHNRCTADGISHAEKVCRERAQKFTPIRRQVPVTDYLRIQARYAHLFKPEEKTEVIDRIQAAADRNIRRFNLAERAGSPAPVAGGQ